MPYITRHPEILNLIIAGGASYTHGKDLPTIGKTIVKVLDDRLEESSRIRHGWRRLETPEPSSQPLLASGRQYHELETEARRMYEQSGMILVDLSDFYI